MRTQGLLVLGLGLALAFGGCDKGTDDAEVFQATLSGSNEVPARSTAGLGETGFTFDGTTVRFAIEVDDILDVTQAHIHSGAAGVNGPVRVFLFPPPPASAATSTPFSTADRRILSEGSFTAADVGGVTFDELLSQMRGGTAYVNVHTRTFPGGEIRGQIRLLN